MSPHKKVVFVGVNTPNPQQETGLYSLLLDEVTGELRIAQKFSEPKNIGFFHLQKPNFLYALSGGGINPTETPNVLWRFRLDRENPQNLLDPVLVQLDDSSATRDGACYVHVSDNSHQPKRVAIVYYFTGNVDFYEEDGNRLTRKSTINFQEFSNVDKDRQEISHPHCVLPIENGNFADYFVVDLGADKVHVDSISQNPIVTDSIPTPPGAGPRHVLRHPSQPLLFVLNELDNTLLVYKIDNRKFTLTDSHSTLFKNDSVVIVENDPIQNAAHLAITEDGKFVLCSNRGTLNSIVVFEIENPEAGMIRLKCVHGPGGHFPRYFQSYGNFLLVANQVLNFYT